MTRNYSIGFNRVRLQITNSKMPTATKRELIATLEACENEVARVREDLDRRLRSMEQKLDRATGRG